MKRGDEIVMDEGGESEVDMKREDETGVER